MEEPKEVKSYYELTLTQWAEVVRIFKGIDYWRWTLVKDRDGNLMWLVSQSEQSCSQPGRPKKRK